MAKARSVAETVCKNAQLPALWTDLYRTIKRVKDIKSSSNVNLIPQLNLLLTSVSCHGSLTATHSIRLNNSSSANDEAINLSHHRETPSPSSNTVQNVGKAILKAALRPAACIAARPLTDSFRIYHVVDQEAIESSSDTEYESISYTDNTSTSYYYSHTESFDRHSYRASEHTDDADDESDEHYSTASSSTDRDQQSGILMSLSSSSPKLINRSPVISSDHVSRIDELLMEDEMEDVDGAFEDISSCGDVFEELEIDVCSEEDAISAFAESVLEMVIYRRIAKEEELMALFGEFVRANTLEHEATIAKAFLVAMEKLCS